MKKTILSIIEKLATIEVQNQDRNDVLLCSNIWQGQLDDLIASVDIINLPACYVEIVAEQNQMLGSDFSGKDATVRLHILHENYNNEGGLDANLLVFDLRDKVLGIMNKFTPTNASSLVYVSENLDTAPTNIYHYVIDFRTHIIENMNEILDSNYGGVLVETLNNPTLQVDEVITDNI